MAKGVAVITGASAGLGAEFARQLCSRGHRLVLVARREDKLQDLAEQLGNARAVALDLTAPDAAARLIDNVDTAGEQIDLLVNNAGFGLNGSFAKLDAGRLRAMIDLNIGTLTDLCRIVAPRMIERRSGAILNVASTAAFQPGPYMAVYYATKTYVLSFTEALHQELKPYGIKVSALCPGPTSTEFMEVAGIGERSALNRLSMAAEPVVRAGLDGLEANRAVVIPGLLNKSGASLVRLSPRALIRRVVARVNKPEAF